MPGLQKPIVKSKKSICVLQMLLGFAVIDTQINIKFEGFRFRNEQNGIYYFEKAAIISILSILAPLEYTLFIARINTGELRIMYWYCRRVNVSIYKLHNFAMWKFIPGVVEPPPKKTKTKEEKLEVQRKYDKDKRERKFLDSWVNTLWIVRKVSWNLGKIT